MYRDWRPRRGGATPAARAANQLRLPGDLGLNDPRRRRPSDAANDAQTHSPTPAPPDEVTRRNRRYSDGSMLNRDVLNENVTAEAEAVRLEKDKDDDGGDRSGSSSDDEYDADTDASTDQRGRGRGRVEDGGSSPQTPNSPDPTITITPPPTANMHHKTKAVHPHSAYDHKPRSAASSPNQSDEEATLKELRRAQGLPVNASPIHSTPSAHRVIRQIVRGDYSYFQGEAEDGRRRQRMYLVATDLSPEAEYALEWTIGTVLRDGDTLFAVYAVDEEGGTGVAEGVEIGHGVDAVRDTASIVRSLPTQRVASPAPGARGPRGSSISKLPRDSSMAKLSGGDREGMSKAERERFSAAEDISGRVIKLLRKTRLQIRVVVEVIHCKSPRHMITEIIDYLSPTLVILGSRGRSALKGVLLGSFSNYLVTKSSIPVMVARKRLRKHSKRRFNKDGLPVAYAGQDGRMRYGRMSNILEPPLAGGKKANRLVGAKID